MARTFSSLPRLPIDDVLGSLRAALVERTSVVLQAPPGAGKTTRVPLALLDEPWLGKKVIVMLEPRRLAARAAARPSPAGDVGDARRQCGGHVARRRASDRERGTAVPHRDTLPAPSRRPI